MISVVCVYNNKDVLDRCLAPSLEKQTAPHERILLDNTGRRFRSAAEALNFGARSARGKYIMFIHHDMAIGAPGWLEEVERTLDALPNLGAAGAAGVAGGSGVFSNISHCDPPKPAGDWRIDAPVKVQTLDECALIVPAEVFKGVGFDEKACDNWHLYGVEYCLGCGERGLDVYAIPMAAHHMTFSTGSNRGRVFSPGVLPEAYYGTLRKILKKHRRQYRRVYTTCGVWDTAYPVFLQRAYYILFSYALYYRARLSRSRRVPRGD